MPLSDRFAGEPPLALLVVEREPAAADEIERVLRQTGLRVAPRRLSTTADLRAALRGGMPDAILYGAMPADEEAADTLRATRHMAPDTPVIFVSGATPPPSAIAAVRGAGVDCVLETHLLRLPDALVRVVGAARESARRRRAEADLKASRQAVAAMLENVDSAVSSYSIPERRYLYVSPAAERVYGRPLEDFYRDHDVWREFVHPDDIDAFFATRDALMHDGRADLEYRIVCPDGAIRWIAHRAKVAFDDAGLPIRVDSVGTDVTETVQQRRQLQRLGRIRDLLSALDSAIVRLTEPQQLARETCRIATRVGGLPSAMVIIFDGDAGTVEIPASAGSFWIEGAERSAREALRDPLAAPGLLAEALRTRRPAVVNDLEPTIGTVPGRQELFDAGLRAIASFPFTIDGTRSGVLALGSFERDFFSPDEIELLSSLASNLAFALELAAKRQRLDYLSSYDPLTELPNRTLALDRLSAAIVTAKGGASRIALLIVDVRAFAAINTTLGQTAGDEVLRALARRLVERFGAARVARLAGDQFAILLPELRDMRDVVAVLGHEGLAILRAPVPAAGRDVRITAQVGCSVFPDDGRDAYAMFRAAEAALQTAKISDVPYRFYSRELELRLRHRLDLENRLRSAAAEQQFVLHYQPKVHVAGRGIAGVEALIRWRDPRREAGLVPPMEFIPALEETGLIVDVGRWALREACAQYQAWVREGLDAPRIAVNVSPVQLRGADFVDDVCEAIAAHGGSGLDIEVTESAVMEDVRLAVEVLRGVRACGVHVAMDDFGTGYSSLSNLLQLPITTLKIDRTFIHGVTTDDMKHTIVSTVITLGRELNLSVVAEGVETEEQAHLLGRLHCDQIQGFLTGRPMPAGELAKLLATA